jgi:glycosyltransferase involved in cell wall biosynthesis
MELSIIIPARNEMFLAKTIENILENIGGDTEVIAVCDGNWPDPPVQDHPRVTLIYNPVPIGQRECTNQGVRLSRAKYIMKVDAHCAFDKDFDVKMMKRMQPDYTMAPVMRNLHAFDWVCPDGHRRYQGPSGPCTTCGKDTQREIMWIGKGNPQSDSYCFDNEPHFQYFKEWRSRATYKEQLKSGLTDTMSLQGSCWMLTREKYWELDVCDDRTFGHWGSQGIEVAVKTWLSGGRVCVNHTTWYGHMFRTQGGDFGFPYKISGRQVAKAKQNAKDLFFNNKYPKQVYPLTWLLEKFWPIPGWKGEDLERLNKNTIVKHSPSVGLVYYTDNRLDPKIMQVVQKRLLNCSNGHDIVSVSLNTLDFGRNIVYEGERGYLTYFRQILAGLEASQADIIYLVEHDVLYPKSHFDFIPPTKEYFYYNLNHWQVRTKDGLAVFTYPVQQVCGLCAYRDLLVGHYRRKVAQVEKEGFSRVMGFEPGKRRHGGVDNIEIRNWESPHPYIDIKHGRNLTGFRWDRSQFRRQPQKLEVADEIPYWGKTKGRFSEFLEDALQKV